MIMMGQDLVIPIAFPPALGLALFAYLENEWQMPTWASALAGVAFALAMWYVLWPSSAVEKAES